MSYGMGLGAGLKALIAARMGVQTAGHNISNMNTLGYTRQRVLQSAAMPFSPRHGLQIGTGVQIDSISRIADEGLEARIRMQLSVSGGAEVDQYRWREIEDLFGEPDGGISTALTDLFGNVGKLQTNADDRALRGGLVQSGKTLAENFNLIASRFQDLRDSTVPEVKALVVQVNQHAKAVAELNTQILALEANGSEANDLRDSRAQHVKEIAKLLDTNAIERGSGAVDIMVGGYLLVSGSVASSLGVARQGEVTQVTIGRTDTALQITTGRIGGLLRHEGQDNPALVGKLDGLAKNLALEWNRIHTTGRPRAGYFTNLTAHNPLKDANGNGNRGDELLVDAGLPFALQSGELWVAVRNTTTGDVERTRIAIDKTVTTVADLTSALDAIDHISASVDPAGRLRITAENGYGFDFASALDEAPDVFGSFGGNAPSFASTAAGPFPLTVPASFTVNVNGTPRAVSLTAADFATPAAATTDELVTAINTQIGNYVTAKNVGGRLVLRSDSSGTTATMSLTDGTASPLAALGMTTGSVRTGTARSVSVAVEGSYTGTGNGRFVFVANGDGQIGVTQGLSVSVYDQNGTLVSTLNVGQGYSPGEKIDVAAGVKVSFGAGTVSATAHDVFSLDTLTDSDSSDVLVALGLNSFFWGSSAKDLQVSTDIEQNLDLLAAKMSTGNDNLQRLIDLRKQRLGDLEESSIEDYYTEIVGDVGFTTASTRATLEAQSALMDALDQQREQVSGVNLDEETVDLSRFQQAFEAASRFIGVVQELTQTLINLGR